MCTGIGIVDDRDDDGDDIIVATVVFLRVFRFLLLLSNNEN